MPNKIFQKIIDSQIENFKKEFGNLPNDLFFTDNKLYHPAEYGKYRERIVRNLFKSILYEDLRISEGFLINNDDGWSTQCDIIIYDYNNTPILKDSNDIFIPVETAVSIGEVKSEMTKSDFRVALRKLAANKKLKDFATGIPLKINNTGRKFDPLHESNDQLFSFLICKKLNFDFNKIEFDDLYDGIERKNRHNLILSIEDGIFNYHFNFDLVTEDKRSELISRGVDTTRSSNIQQPIFLEANCKNNFIAKSDDNIYIKEFLSYCHSSIHNATILQVDIRTYYRDFDRLNTLFKK